MRGAGPHSGAGGRRNRLASSSSPYLLQHALNPVDWWEWGEEAFAEARRLDRPIFLSIGYSTCYWCHVMEREVFEDEAIARLMNERFVCVKVDREQRPDLDEVYMAATQVATGHGGWPNSVFLTPDLKPFYAGTYFGPTDQHGRPGFPRVLLALEEAWREQRGDVEAQAEELTRVVRQVLGERMHELTPVPVDRAIVRACIAELKETYDPRDGGFGLAPKFPQGFLYPLLCDALAEEPDEALLEIVGHTLRRMQAGGMFDQVGGGFHRYSTDARWLIPHFEKMLYDQAALVSAYTSGWEVTGDDVFRWTVEDTLAFVGRELTGPSGEFHSALDAETLGREGQFYLWTDEELKRTLGPGAFDLFAEVYGLAEVPHIAGHARPEGGAVWMRESLPSAAARMGLEPGALRSSLAPLLDRLLAARSARERPRLDTKVITAWNGLMIGACARAYAALGDPRHRAMAERAAAFAMERLARPSAGEHALWRTWTDGRSEIPGFQEDYAMLAQGLLALGGATGERRWVEEAAALLTAMRRRFWDADRGGYYFAEPDPRLIVRGKHPTDGAIPSGNSAAAHAFLDLHELTGESGALKHVDQILSAHAGLLARSPSGVAHMTHAVLRRARLREGGPPGLLPLRGGAPSGVEESSSKVRIGLVGGAGGLLPGTPFRLAIRIDVAEGWKINANPAGPGLLPTVVDVRSEAPLREVAIDYPNPSPDPEIDRRFWAGRVVVVATIVPADSWSPPPGRATTPLRALCRLQACGAGVCLAESILSATFDAPVGGTASKPEDVGSLRRRVREAP